MTKDHTNNVAQPLAAPVETDEAELLEIIAQALCSAGGNGFLCDCHPRTQAAYRVQAKAVLEVLPKSVRRSSAGNEDVRWAVNYLLEQIAAKFEAWDTFDLFRSEAAATVRAFKHDLSDTAERAILGVLKEAAAALEYLADRPRPIGGQGRFNAEHLYDIALNLRLLSDLPQTAPDTKLVYVKRWRTLVSLPTKYADEIVEALR